MKSSDNVIRYRKIDISFVIIDPENPYIIQKLRNFFGRGAHNRIVPVIVGSYPATFDVTNREMNFSKIYLEKLEFI